MLVLGLGVTPPWRLVDQRLDTGKQPHVLEILLEADRGVEFPCPACGRPCKAHDFKEFTWRHLNFFQPHCLITARGLDLSGLKAFAFDETASKRGHNFATVVIDPTVKKVLWVGRGRGRADIRPFFELLGAAGRARIKAVAMDMNAAYETEVRAQCPNAEVVFDLFHVVAKYGREVVDRLRVDEANRLRDDKPARKVVKSARWLLLRNRDNIRRTEDRVRLDELLAANQALMTAYVLKDDLKELWRQRSQTAAVAAWKSWFARAIESGIKPLVAFARKLEAYLPGILAHAGWPMNTSLLEGFNNKIKVIKRMAYGFRDDEYFFLKIRDAFPGIPG